MISLPIYYTKTYKTKSDKTFLVGMNWFRNAHHHEQNEVKQYYHELISKNNVLTPITGTFTLDIKIYYKSPICDGSNIASLMEKFTLDALQELSIILQDNVQYHLGTTWSIAGQDKFSPRCEISLIPKVL